MMFSPAAAALPHVQTGALKALASAGARRAGAAPDLPTMMEAGIPDFDTSLWFAMWAPAGSPREAIDKIARAANEALASPDVASNLKAQGFDIIGGTPDDFARMIDREMEKWTAAAKAAGLKK